MSQGGPPGSDARAIIWGQKLMTYVDFVIKYFMSPQNIGENKVGSKGNFFFPHHCTTLNLQILNFSRSLIFSLIFMFFLLFTCGIDGNLNVDEDILMKMRSKGVWG